MGFYMKKNIGLSVFLFSLLFTLTSCNIQLADENLLASPTCQAQSNGNLIAISKSNSDTKYINIYRQDVSGGAAGEVENIGIVYPKKDDSTSFFTDEYAVQDHTYTYYARIWDGSDYYKTSWSSGVKTTSTTYTDVSPAPKYAAGGTWSYTKSDYKITYTLASDPSYPLAIVVQSPSKTQIFALEQTNGGTNEVISLTGLLSTDYYDVPVKILGICGQTISKYDNGDKKEVHWTPLTQITVSGTGVSNNTFTISTSSGGNIEDYSRQLNKN